MKGLTEAMSMHLMGGEPLDRGEDLPALLLNHLLLSLALAKELADKILVPSDLLHSLSSLPIAHWSSVPPV